jgi:hypothetical protein
MILCEWDALEGDPGKSCVHLYARILSSSLTSVSIFSVYCYSIVSISMVQPDKTRVPIELNGILGMYQYAP